MKGRQKGIWSIVTALVCLSLVFVVEGWAETVQTRIGELEFSHDFENGYPTDETVKKCMTK